MLSVDPSVLKIRGRLFVKAMSKSLNFDLPHYMPCGQDMGWFSPERRRLQGDFVAAFQCLKGAYEKDGDKLFSRACCKGQGVMALNQKRVDLDWIQGRNFFYNEGDEALAQVAWRCGRCPIPGNIQGQVGRGSEQPDRVEDVPAHCRGELN